MKVRKITAGPCQFATSAYWFPSFIPIVCTPMLSVPLGVIMAYHTGDTSFFESAILGDFLRLYRVQRRMQASNAACVPYWCGSSSHINVGVQQGLMVWFILAS
jgi:hypothetical protein